MANTEASGQKTCTLSGTDGSYCYVENKVENKYKVRCQGSNTDNEIEAVCSSDFKECKATQTQKGKEAVTGTLDFSESVKELNLVTIIDNCLN